MEEKNALPLVDCANLLANMLMENYWKKIWDVLEMDAELKKNFTNFLLNPEKIIFYLGKTHWGIEYIGNINSKQISSNKKVEVKIIDYSKADNLLTEILGIDYGNQTGPTFPLLEYSEDLVHPTNEAIDILLDNGWNLAGQTMIINFNAGEFVLQEGMCHRIVNGFFYGTNRSGLVTRNIKWLDLFPLQLNDEDVEVDEFKFYIWPNIKDVILHDAHFNYPLPSGFREEKWYSLNRFVELISSKDTKEPQITAFLAKPENQFILKMAFMGKNISSECELEWQSEKRRAIRPDFFIEGSNGYSDIVEFKLPNLKNINSTVGRENRQTFSAEIHSYISQTRDYEYYFEDPKNRKFAEEKHGINIYYPKRILVIGRRSMLDTPDWKRLENDYRNIMIKTYDEVIDLVLSHLYL
ncbi:MULTISPECIES: Shedu anti-phage system protein SduA domain-containing protein [unclassified Exiguobacterium]|uniref:Shedu anti-phage system protein SduA domain-containing protein n=1 Tax=unclassified Exiguobacterium TaxID=2644629 RepID=UPI001BE567C5|nr:MULTISPECIES: Shedu anti-phage system protein SduA domain-containing protein [unclassified Exiguobacterium]